MPSWTYDNCWRSSFDVQNYERNDGFGKRVLEYEKWESNAQTKALFKDFRLVSD